MPASETNDTALTVRALARERARRRARIAQREANRSRGFIGAGALAGLAALLWILAAAVRLPMWLPIAATLLGLAYAGGLIYLLREMATATAADLAAIDDLNRELGQARGANREITRRRAKAAASLKATRKAKAGQVPEISAKAATPAAKAPAESAQPAAAAPETAEAAKPVRHAAPVAAKPVAAPTSSVGLPSYTLKRTSVQRRDIEPYKAPQSDEAPVPYRPKSVGEKVANPAHAARSIVSATPESAESLAGGSALDALLDRRRA